LRVDDNIVAINARAGHWYKDTHMNIHILVATLVASVALVAPADAASQKKKKVAHRAPIGAAYSNANASSSYDVYVSGERVGRDPDPSIRAYMMRNPHGWDGPE